MITVSIELDIVSAAILEYISKNKADETILNFLAEEVKQTDFRPEGETNQAH
jgi:hypothetical protein